MKYPNYLLQDLLFLTGLVALSGLVYGLYYYILLVDQLLSWNLETELDDPDNDSENDLIDTFTSMTGSLDPASALNTYTSECCDEDLDDNHADKPSDTPINPPFGFRVGFTDEPDKIRKRDFIFSAIIGVSIVEFPGPAILVWGIYCYVDPTWRDTIDVLGIAYLVATLWTLWR